MAVVYPADKIVTPGFGPSSLDFLDASLSVRLAPGRLLS